MQTICNKNSNPDLFQLKLKDLTVELGRNYFDKNLREEVVKEFDKLPKQIKKLFSDNLLNITEKRQVSHVAYRDKKNNFSLHSKIQNELNKAYEFSEKLIQHSEITDIVNIGIGGSHLGNELVCDALQDFYHGKFRCHFISSPDPDALNDLLKKLNPKTTLWLFVSKTFTTLEILLLHTEIKKWCLEKLTQEELKKHFIAITSQSDKPLQLGFSQEQCFWFDEGLGGRYSLWSTIGLIIILMIGKKNHQDLLNGAYCMDQHFLNEPLSTNIPFWLGWLDYYYNQYFSAQSRLVAPYTVRLKNLPSYLQQLEMESLGKSVHKDSSFVEPSLGLVVWGGVEPNGQHAFHQFLYQSQQLIPVEFIAIKKANIYQNLQNCQLAQCFAQSKALWEGDTKQENHHKKINGYKPSTIILLNQLNPYNLGMLLSMYEHKVFILGELYDINAFDQYGVELGKKLAAPIMQAQETKEIDSLDKITQCYIRNL